MLAALVLAAIQAGCALNWNATRVDRLDATVDVPLEVEDGTDAVVDVVDEDVPLDVPDDTADEDVDDDATDAVDVIDDDAPPLTFDPIPVISDDLRTYLEAMSIPTGAGAVREITPSRRTRWQTLVNDILSGDYASAWTGKDLLSVDLVVVDDTVSGRPYIVASQLARGEGIFVFAAVWTNPLVVEVPYPVTASGTLGEGVEILRGAGGRVMLVAGGGRCTNTWYSTCDGTTVACEGSESSYYTSDVAHYMNLAYQVVHEHVMDFDVGFIAVQLQDGTDIAGASAVISDGTTAPDTVTPSISVALRDALRTYFPITISPLYSCNDPGDSGYTSSCNTGNVQGRSTNGSSDPCFTAASS
ncbi:MAG: hypothetical protein JRG91_19960, partial [Deltaproteobacteria bacterium]|nr:hypothetical protein [Deltaproteobacteria bacterium]